MSKEVWEQDVKDNVWTKEEATKGGWRKLNIEEFHDLYCLLIKKGAMGGAYNTQGRDRFWG
jgi:hypothetical protein